MHARKLLQFLAPFWLCAVLYAQDSAPVSSQSNAALPMATDAAPSQAASNENGLQRYGYNLFQPGDYDQEFSIGALPDDYRLGPGDQLTLFLGGKTQENFQLTVSMDGKLYIPTVGVLFVSGLTLDQFKDLLDKRLSAYYSDYNLNIMLTMPKMVGVRVIGEVRAPGNYSASALATVLEFIKRAKGVTLNGSFRNIQIFRQDSLFAYIDLYDFMMRPGEQPGFFLQSGDIIFVPVIASIITVTGEVNRQAIYELNPNKSETIADIIRLAGGFTETAFREKVEVSRLLPDGTRKAIYFDLRDLDRVPGDAFARSGDQVHVFSILDQAPQDSVAVFGQVNRPGRYAYQKNMRVSDLILHAGSLKRSAYLLSAELAKVDPGANVETIKLDLQKIMAGDETADVMLDADDQLFIRKKPEWEIGAVVYVKGEVKFPGYYAIKEDSTYLSEILRAAGGFTKDALVQEAKLVRRRDAVIEDKEYERLAQMSRSEMSDSEYEYFVMKHNSDNVDEIVVDFERLVLQRDRSEDVVLKDGDRIIVPKRPGVVYVSGRVSKPGGILYVPQANFDYYIAKAGGYTWDANKRRTKIIKVTGEIVKASKIKKFEPGDRIFVPRKQDRDYWRTFYDVVMILGQLAAVYLVVRTASNK